MAKSARIHVNRRTVAHRCSPHASFRDMSINEPSQIFGQGVADREWSLSDARIANLERRLASLGVVIPSGSRERMKGGGRWEGKEMTAVVMPVAAMYGKEAT